MSNCIFICLCVTCVCQLNNTFWILESLCINSKYISSYTLLFIYAYIYVYYMFLCIYIEIYMFA